MQCTTAVVLYLVRLTLGAPKTHHTPHTSLFLEKVRKIRDFVDTTLIAHYSLDPKTVPQCAKLVAVTKSALVGGYYLFSILGERKSIPTIHS